MKTNFESRLSALFDNRADKEQEFRANRKCLYAATELAYVERFLNGETDLRDVVSKESIEIIKELKNS